MIRQNKEKRIEVREHAFDGEGKITVRSLLNNEEEMYHKGRVFAHTSLPPGSSIGYHIHSGESETYYIYSGIGEFNDNGTLKTVQKGDVTFTPAQEGHGIKNIGDEPLELIALILYE
ncbi:MAG: cupin domain-containing protein [Anaerolineales bacterium]|nr:cupin domain-containing protein [Anaerolineales bacterium]